MSEWTTQVLKQHGMDPNILLAIITVESAGNPFAVRYEPQWKYHHFPREVASRLNASYETEVVMQSCSWGLMQIMGSVAREKGFSGWLSELTKPELNIHYGALHFKGFLERHGNLSDAVACYNAGSVRKTKGGNYVNQVYVDKVMGEYRKLTEIKP
jgi:soluble lytic murein transglycosylase-like protein